MIEGSAPRFIDRAVAFHQRPISGRDKRNYTLERKYDSRLLVATLTTQVHLGRGGFGLFNVRPRLDRPASTPPMQSSAGAGFASRVAIPLPGLESRGKEKG